MAVVLSDDERETLERWARRPTSAQALALRCRIVLAAAEGTPNTEIAAALGCHPVTAGKWRRRFAQRRLDGLSDEPRPGAPRTISDARIEAVIVKTLEEQPHNATQWSTRSMAAAVGMSQTAISKIWRAFGLKPHLVEHFKLSPDPQFIDKVRDVAGLYLNPPEAAPSATVASLPDAVPAYDTPGRRGALPGPNEGLTYVREFHRHRGARLRLAHFVAADLAFDHPHSLGAPENPIPVLYSSARTRHCQRFTGHFTMTRA